MVGCLRYAFISDITDNGLRRFYFLLGQERLRRFFYERDDLCCDDFVRYCRLPDIKPYFVFLDGKPIAMCVLNSLKGKVAWGHFILAPGIPMRHKDWPTPVAVMQGMLAQWLYARNDDGEYALDRILGLTPLFNTAAVKMTERVGGERMAVVPGMCFDKRNGVNVDGLITAYTRENIPEDFLGL